MMKFQNNDYQSEVFVCAECLYNQRAYVDNGLVSVQGTVDLWSYILPVNRRISARAVEGTQHNLTAPKVDKCAFAVIFISKVRLFYDMENDIFRFQAQFLFLYYRDHSGRAKIWLKRTRAK